MGMDVYGRNPKNEDGKYFGANVWSWRPIHAIMGIVNSRAGGVLINEKTMDSMACNDGAGLKHQDACTQLADAIEEFLTDSKSLRDAGFIVNRDDRDPEEIGISFPLDTVPEMAVGENGQFVTQEKLMTMTEKEKATLRSPYGTSYSHVREFVKFLRNCGGFEVN